MSNRCLASITGVLAVLAVSGKAKATPRTLPFTYPYETLPEGSAEVEQYVDFSPTKANTALGAVAWYGATQFQTEFEYGITDRLELGLYVTYAPDGGGSFVNTPNLTEGNGMKQRLRLRLAEEGQWPVDTALYLELVEKQNEMEVEGKVILQRRFGDLKAMVNAVVEREFYYNGQRDWVLAPTAGITYQITPTFQPGIESWMRVEYPDSSPNPRPFALGPHVYVGPVAHLNFGRLWCSIGGYLRATDTSRKLQPADPFGNFWVRSVIGLDL